MSEDKYYQLGRAEMTNRRAADICRNLENAYLELKNCKDDAVILLRAYNIYRDSLVEIEKMANDFLTNVDMINLKDEVIKFVHGITEKTKRKDVW